MINDNDEDNGTGDDKSNGSGGSDELIMTMIIMTLIYKKD